MNCINPIKERINIAAVSNGRNLKYLNQIYPIITSIKLLINNFKFFNLIKHIKIANIKITDIRHSPILKEDILNMPASIRLRKVTNKLTKTTINDITLTPTKNLFPNNTNFFIFNIEKAHFLQ